MCIRDSHATPQKIARVLRDLPQLTMVCAHMGSMERWDEVEQYLCGKRVYFDTAFTAGYLSPAQAERIISRHGAQNILFGSDCPWQASSATYRFIDSLHISSVQKDMIFYPVSYTHRIYDAYLGFGAFLRAE